MTGLLGPMSLVATSASLEGVEVGQDAGHRLTRALQLVRLLARVDGEGAAEQEAVGGLGAGDRAALGRLLHLRDLLALRAHDLHVEAVERPRRRTGRYQAQRVVRAAVAGARVDVSAGRVG